MLKNILKNYINKLYVINFFFFGVLLLNVEKFLIIKLSVLYKIFVFW